jgi:hypothetical protein
MNYIETEKTYIGKVEAFEIMMERNIESLPRKNKQWLTVPSVASGLNTKILGKDDDGYYIAELIDID